ncbi:MAG: transcriptional regulator [Gemmatimonadetes bacterium]|nr:transcriptional regulator [Gemmatimonadota bacterium]|tara:strand:- start:420 stop:743 length:324 start_codon:yes stop_codon:yes gene_type:complete
MVTALNDVESLADRLQALSDPVRLRLMKMLPCGEAPCEMCVCDLADQLGVSQPNTSHHLRVLRSAGLIRCQRRGGFAYYHVDRDVLECTLFHLDQQLLTREAKEEVA